MTKKSGSRSATPMAFISLITINHFTNLLQNLLLLLTDSGGLEAHRLRRSGLGVGQQGFAVCHSIFDLAFLKIIDMDKAT